VDEQGECNPVQIWTSIWDNRDEKSHYLFFREYFVKPLIRMLGHPCEYNLSPQVQKKLRPKEKDPKGKVNHNRGVWHAFIDFTMIRVYGFQEAPFLLPKIVPN
jgi:hypothetical protein